MTRVKKPVSRATAPQELPHGVEPEIVVTIYPRGLIGLRELGRRKEYQLDVGILYVAQVRREADLRRQSKRKGGRR